MLNLLNVTVLEEITASLLKVVASLAKGKLQSTIALVQYLSGTK
jgi:hypothetical protein